MALFDDSTDTPTPWSTSEVSEVERFIGGPLPGELRDFLVTTGAGDFGEHVVPNSGDNGIARYIYGPNEVTGGYEVEGGDFEYIPRKYLPIIAGGGGAFCIGLEGEARGRMYWADFDLAHQELDEGESSEMILSRSADSWNELIAQIPGWPTV